METCPNPYHRMLRCPGENRLTCVCLSIPTMLATNCNVVPEPDTLYTLTWHPLLGYPRNKPQLKLLYSVRSSSP